jgi:hypothetical protein
VRERTTGGSFASLASLGERVWVKG